jgi:Tol biopolymer transport system component/DNA-binding SARP family transcriptional activator
MIKLRTLGSVSVEGDGSPALQRRPLALLAVLAAAGDFGVSRDKLVAYFWPDSDDERARNVLRQLLHTIRRDLHAQNLFLGTTELRLNSAVIVSDLTEFERACSSGDYETAVTLYRGPFLDGFYLSNAAGFDNWRELERTRIARRFVDAAERLGRAASAAGDHRTALAMWQRLAVAEPLNSRIATELMRTMAAAGDTGGALQHARIHETLLREELGTQLAPEVVSLIEQLKRQRSPAPVVPPSASFKENDVTSALPFVAAGPLPLADQPVLTSSPTTSTGLMGRAPGWFRVVAGGMVAVAASITVAALSRDQRAARTLAVGATMVVSADPDLEVEPTVSPNGEMVAYASGPLGAMRIFVRPVGGGKRVLLSGSISGDHRWPRWSPDGRQILFVAKPSFGPHTGALYIVPALGGAPALLSGPNEPVMTPTWSADGRLIAFSDGNDILVRALAGGASTRVVDEYEAHSPAFSPDGRFIAYVTGDIIGESALNSAPSAISVVPATGGVARRLTDATHSNRSPAWSADGRSVLYLSNVAGASDLYQQRLTPNGERDGAPVRLTTGLGAATIALAASGSTVVYSVVRRRSQIWSAPIPARGTSPTGVLTLVTREAQAIEGLDVSRDGKWLVYDSDRSGNQDIYKVGANGGEPIRLTHDPAPDYVPQWSWDGAEIAYYSVRTGNRDVRVMSAEGRDDRAVTDDPVEELYPAWSPDDRALAFQRHHRLTRDFMVIRRDSAGTWGDARPLPSVPDAQFPRWSPDGRWVSFEAGGSLVIVAPSGDSTRTLVAKGALGGRVHFAVWGTDPRFVYVKTIEANLDAAFWEVPLSGERPRLLLRLDDPSRRSRRGEFATDGRRLFFTLAADEGDLGALTLEY